MNNLMAKLYANGDSTLLTYLMFHSVRNIEVLIGK